MGICLILLYLAPVFTHHPLANPPPGAHQITARVVKRDLIALDKDRPLPARVSVIVSLLPKPTSGTQLTNVPAAILSTPLAMQRSSAAEGNGEMSSPTYPQPNLYDHNQGPPTSMARGMYYPYTQQEEVTGSWASYTAHESYPPQSSHPPTSLWYAAQTDGPGPSHGGPTHGSSPYPAQYGRRPSFSQSDYAPVSSAPGNEDEPVAVNGAEGTSTPVNGAAKEKSAGNKKKKRKSEREPSVGSGDAADKDREKRIKTGRACDACVGIQLWNIGSADE